MKKRKILSKIIASGLWLQPIVMIVLVKYLKTSQPKFLMKQENWILCLLISFFPVLFVIMERSGKPKEEDAMSGKEKAKYPEIDESLLYKKPTGILLGMDKHGRYVCKGLEEDGHIFLIGGSGSGKSSCHGIPACLINKTPVIAVDIKKEFSTKAVRYGSKRVKIFDPSDRNQHGYDPLYELNANSSTQQIMETMQTISYSLIQMPPDIKDPFWKTSSRNLLIGLLIFYYKQGTRDFVGIIDQILGKPVKESIQEVMENARPTSVEYRYIVQFKDMEDETLGGIVAEMNNHIIIFANDQDIRYAMERKTGNPRKINPLMIEKGYSIYLSIKEEKLTAYYDVMQLIINQIIAQLEKRPEDSKPVIFLIDELPRILSAGKLDRLLDGARTLRSRKVTLFLITQSTEALMSAFTESEVSDLISNCPYIIVLSASSSKTQEAVVKMCGKYFVRKTSWSGVTKEMKPNVSYDEKDIVDPSELMTLKQTGEAILITPYGYSRVKKVPYYKDKYLKPIADKIEKYNKTVMNM